MATALTMAHTVNSASGTICRAIRKYCTLAAIWMPMATKTATKMIQATPPSVTQKVLLARPSAPKSKNA